LRSRQKEKLGLLLLLLFSCLVLYIRFSPILTASPHQVIQGYGDAFNAYNLVTYHAKYDSTYTAFEGMAYPYGDHVVIASAIPLISNSLKWMKAVGWDLTDYTVPIIHYSMLFSYLLCALFLYLIFSRLALPAWLSIVIAIALTFMAPQTERLFGHYGLAHLFPIPATIYFLLLFDEKPRWWVSICLFLTVLLSSLIQFYFFAMTAMMIGIFYFFSLTGKSKAEKKLPGERRWHLPLSEFLKYAVHFSFQVLIPLLIFLWWLDQYEVPDRPDKPYGYTLFISYWEGLFLSLRMPYYEWIDKNLLEIRRVNFEGLAYTGLVAFVVFSGMVVFWCRHLFRRSFFQKLAVIPANKAEKVHANELILMKGLTEIVYDDADFLRRLFAMSFVLLLFSFGLPFSLPGCEFLLDYAGPFRQFRSVGRFNWVFYFVLNIVVFTFLFRKFRKRQVWLLLPLSILVYESWQFNHARKYSMDTVKEFKKGQTFTDQTGLDFSRFQAILSIPYFNVGTDNFDAKVHGRIQQKSLVLSMETGLPLLASMGNRSSVSRAYKLFQMVAEPYRVPSILQDFKNEKPLLLMVDTSHLNRFPLLAEGTRLLAQEEAIKFYELPLQAYTTRVNNRKEATRSALFQDTALYETKGWFLSDSTDRFIYRNFDTLKSAVSYRGGGALKLDISQLKIIFQEDLSLFRKGEKVVFSFWCDLSKYPAATTFIHFKLYHPVDKKVVWEFKPQLRYLIPVMDNNGWCLFELPFEVVENGWLDVGLENVEMTDQSFWLDELFIRPATLDVYKGDDLLFKNNRYY